jgi:UDP-N-acetylmuramoylalanine--D-glutamate ligase
VDLNSYFSGKKITVMGLGLLGRGVGDARFLAEKGAELIVTDLKTEEALADSVAQLKDFPNVTFVLGTHRLEDFRDRDFILKAAGVPLDSPYILEAEKAGIPIKMSASWFAELSEIPVVGITGTRGKSSVTHMLHAILLEAGIPTLLGGNVRGVSTLALLNELTDEHVALFELDSWQLQGFGDAKLSPNIAIFTTFLSDHMNYYKDDMGRYLADKANIFLNQEPTDMLILGSQCAELVTETYGDQIKAHTIVAGSHDFRADWKLQVPGEHNRYNAALAMEAARALAIDDDVIERGLASFAGVPGRLELVREIDGVRFYNDTNSTTEDATLVALEALGEEKRPVSLIMGGADKGLSVDALLRVLPEKTVHVSLLAGTGTDRIKDALAGVPVFGSLEEAVADARAHTPENGAVLFSPAFASFGMFKNEYDRGDQFTELVRAL